MSDSEHIPGVPDRDLAILAGVGFFFAPGIAVVALGKWQQFCDWCLDYNILVSGAADPLVALPKADGAGIDLPRLVIAVALLIAIVGLLFYAVFRRRVARERRARRAPRVPPP